MHTLWPVWSKQGLIGGLTPKRCKKQGQPPEKLKKGLQPLKNDKKNDNTPESCLNNILAPPPTGKVCMDHTA